METKEIRDKEGACLPPIAKDVDAFAIRLPIEGALKPGRPLRLRRAAWI